VTGYTSRLKPAIREQVYLIGREALRNAFRHSQATSVETEVEYLRSRVRVVVRDNGCGMDAPRVRSAASSREAANRGLVGMRERAENIGARLEIWSKPGCGTEVQVSVPRRIAVEA
jgi:signal transduction histidine kinase